MVGAQQDGVSVKAQDSANQQDPTSDEDSDQFLITPCMIKKRINVVRGFLF